MSRKHEQMWRGKLEDINATEMCIDLVRDEKLFKLNTPYKADRKTRELERAEIDKQLKYGIIDQ